MMMEEEKAAAVRSIAGRYKGEKGRPVPLWLITFTDVMALMLTFFVLLYAMSVPQEEKWEEISVALSHKFTQSEAKPFNTATQDVIHIDKIDTSRALDLNYLEALIKNLFESKGIENIIFFQNEKRLIVSLPSEMLFDTGKATMGVAGKQILFTLGGALSRVKNRIEIVGHTDPSPIKGGDYQTNWALSLARSGAVARVLKDVGYVRPVTVRGVSSARYDELPKNMPVQQRYDLSRRVDIILMDDDGMILKF